MAHRHHHHRRNPSFFGLNVERILALVGGASFTQFLDAQFVAPLASGFVPGGINGSTATGRMADGVTTALAAKGTKMLADLIGLRAYADDAELGGYAIAGAKVVSGPIPSITLTATYPQALGKIGLPGGLGGRPTQTLPQPSGATGAGMTTQSLPLPAAGALAGSVTNYSQPANVADDAGI